MKTILVTGGAGYIGSHTVRELGRAGFRPVVVDNLSEGHKEAVLDAQLEVGDLADETFLEGVFKKHAISGVMHFASRCYVGESVENPRRYYEENVGNALTLFRVMLGHGVKRFVLSSTCATYGNPVRVPMDEGHPQAPVNPYGETKLMIEQILRQYDRAYGLRFVSLRYFNAAGASLDGLIGESHEPEPHLIPRILMVANGKLDKLHVFGDDYATPDGTCIRDYIHILDLAAAHLAAMEWLEKGNQSDFFNLGTGTGFSVKEMIQMAEEVTGQKIPVEIGPRREGDPPALVADAAKAHNTLGWVPRCSDLRSIFQTAWQWEQKRRY